MPIQTIEAALRNVGAALSRKDITDKARDAVSRGDVLEITVLVSAGKDGATVTMHSLVASDRASHGRLIRLK